MGLIAYQPDDDPKWTSQRRRIRSFASISTMGKGRNRELAQTRSRNVVYEVSRESIGQILRS